MKDEKAARRRRLLAAVALAVCGYLTVESFLPPERQPTAAVGLAALRAYQAVGSPAMAAAGVRCRYTPSCSHYAAAAVEHYGSMEGLARTAGRLWRCSPWGGTGYDPAVASTRRIARQETPEERKARGEAEKKAAEDMKRTLQELDQQAQKLREEGIPELKEAATECGIACVLGLIASAIGFAVWIVLLIYVIKDSKARGDANALVWILLVVLMPLIGAIVYFVARPKGDLAPCAQCKNRRLETLVKCPHCGEEAPGGAKAS